MAVAAAAPLFIHSLVEAEGSLIFISPLMGSSLEHRRPPPDGGLLTPLPLQLLSAPPLPPESVSAIVPLDSLQALICLIS